MKKLLITSIFLSSFCSFAQDEQQMIVPEHTVCFEMGVNSRGLAGFGYDYNFYPTSNYYFNVHTSAGVGVYYSSGGWFGDIDPSLYLTLSPSFNFGKGMSFFTFGGEFKYLHTEYEYSGYGLGGFIGGTFNFPGGFVFKARAGITQWMDMSDDGPGADILRDMHGINFLPSVGLSFGYAIGHH